MSQYDMSKFKKKIAPRKKEDVEKNAANRFKKADETLGVDAQNVKLEENLEKKKISTVTFSIPNTEKTLITEIKEKALDKRVILSTSEVIRLGLLALSRFSPEKLESAYSKIEKITVGRPKKTKQQ